MIDYFTVVRGDYYASIHIAHEYSTQAGTCGRVGTRHSL